jgi:hypothetical protein
MSKCWPLFIIKKGTEQKLLKSYLPYLTLVFIIIILFFLFVYFVGGGGSDCLITANYAIVLTPASK